MAAADEKRRDPATKAVVTLDELFVSYKGTYSKKDIKAYWETECTPVKEERVLGFYGHHPKTSFCEFSNFFWQQRPYDFQLPEFARRVSPDLPAVVSCRFSEKAIMVTKAALMGDRDTFREIVNSNDPAKVKALGRKVSPWKQQLWEAHLEEVAYEVVLQKFASDEDLKQVLLSTGNKVIAEATSNDRIWGIGIDRWDERVQHPEQWLGRNVLGTALMRARVALGGEPASGPGAPPLLLDAIGSAAVGASGAPATAAEVVEVEEGRQQGEAKS